MREIIAVDMPFRILGFYSSIRFSWNDRYDFSGESHNFWEVVFVLSGEVEITEDENVYHLGKNDMILHAPMEFHRIKSYNGTSPAGLIMSFGAEGVLPQRLKKGIFSLNDTEREEYIRLFDKIYHCVKGGAEDEYEGQEAVLLLSALLLRLSESTAEKKVDRSETAMLYQKIVSSMLASVSQNLTLEDFSRMNNVSVSYLKLLFQKYAGISPKAYFTRLRMQHAEALLKSGMPVCEVAERMDFSSPNYFSEAFKRYAGCAPSEYRKK